MYRSLALSQTVQRVAGSLKLLHFGFLVKQQCFLFPRNVLWLWSRAVTAVMQHQFQLNLTIYDPGHKGKGLFICHFTTPGLQNKTMVKSLHTVRETKQTSYRVDCG